MTTTTAADFASGKGHTDENFPVASRLVAARHRAPILAFYAFARAGDDIADNETASPDDKLARLEALRATLAGEGDTEPTALTLRTVLAERGLTPRHGLELLEAFRRDVTKLRYESWDDLMDYCRWSAMPVGRFVLDVHGEDRARTWPLSDALCAALQIINHLQDCAKDFRALDRVYLPADMLAAASAGIDDLARAAATPALKKVIAALAQRCEGLLATSASFARTIRDRRLGIEVAVIQRLAVDLAYRLRLRDPLSERVHHGKGEALRLAAGAAVLRAIRP